MNQHGSGWVHKIKELQEHVIKWIYIFSDGALKMKGEHQEHKNICHIWVSGKKRNVIVHIKCTCFVPSILAKKRESVICPNHFQNEV